MFMNVFSAGVMMAARSLIQLFRAVNPALLHKKDRVRNVFVNIHLIAIMLSY